MSDSKTKPPSLEEQQQTLAHVMFSIVSAMAPPGTAEAQVGEALQYATQMEFDPGFEQTFNALFDADKVRARPQWGVKLHAGEATHLLPGPKRLQGPQTKVAELCGFCIAFGLFNSPVLRAVLALHGIRTEFVEVAAKPLIHKA